MTEEREIEEDLKPSSRDYIYSGMKAGLSTIPVYGGAVTNILSSILPAPLEKRRTKWFLDFDTRLQLLEKTVQGFKISDLVENEIFISVFFYATNIAMRTHQEEKLEALRNAVINSALMQSADENLNLMFLNLIDRYTPLHLQILELLDNPKKFGKKNGIEYSEDDQWMSNIRLLEKTYTDLSDERPILKQILLDLSSDGMISPASEKRSFQPVHSVFLSKPTEFGEKFLEFIRNPIAFQTKIE